MQFWRVIVLVKLKIVTFFERGIYENNFKGILKL